MTNILQDEIDGMLENQSTLEWEVTELREVAQVLRARIEALDDDLVDPTISYLLGGYKELAADLGATIEELRGRVAELEARLV